MLNNDLLPSATLSLMLSLWVWIYTTSLSMLSLFWQGCTYSGVSQFKKQLASAMAAILSSARCPILKIPEIQSVSVDNSSQETMGLILNPCEIFLNLQLLHDDWEAWGNEAQWCRGCAFAHFNLRCCQGTIIGWIKSLSPECFVDEWVSTMDEEYIRTLCRGGGRGTILHLVVWLVLALGQ